MLSDAQSVIVVGKRRMLRLREQERKMVGLILNEQFGILLKLERNMRNSAEQNKMDIASDIEYSNL